MVKVGILSMQRINNYGSFLQAYALKKLLESMNCEVQFVDYHPGETLVASNEGHGIFRKIKKAVQILQDGASVSNKIKYIIYKKNFSDRYLKYLGIDKNMNYSPMTDLLIIGSDEVFNCIQSNTNVGFSPELFGAGRNSKRLISYAASFGNTTIDGIKRYKIDSKLSEWFKEFDDISVRDRNSESIVYELTGITPQIHLDPVLIYDYLTECDTIPADVPYSHYLLLYGYNNRFTDEECENIRSFADSGGLKIICIGGLQKCCDVFVDCNPFEVISYFNNADYVVTDTFHGTIMSVITHKSFVSYVRDSGYGNTQKIADLLDRLSLKDRIKFDSKSLPEILGTAVNYGNADEAIATERGRAKAYLKSNIKGYE